VLLTHEFAHVDEDVIPSRASLACLQDMSIIGQAMHAIKILPRRLSKSASNEHKVQLLLLRSCIVLYRDNIVHISREYEDVKTAVIIE